MLRVYYFHRLALTVEDMQFYVDPRNYVVDQELPPLQRRPLRGIRIELRIVEPESWRDLSPASQKIVIDRALWRADLLEPLEGADSTIENRVYHFYPAMVNNEPGDPVSSCAFAEDPIGWLETQLDDPVSHVRAAGLSDVERFRDSGDFMRQSLPHLIDIANTCLTNVRAEEPLFRVGMTPQASMDRA